MQVYSGFSYGNLHRTKLQGFTNTLKVNDAINVNLINSISCHLFDTRQMFNIDIN